MSETPGVVSYVPVDAMARTTAAFANGRAWTGVHHVPPPFDGHPSGVLDAELEPPLDELADVTEAPPDPAEVLAGHDARLSALEAMAHSHEPLTSEWDGE